MGACDASVETDISFSCYQPVSSQYTPLFLKMTLYFYIFVREQPTELLGRDPAGTCDIILNYKMI
jgi:hypothetical protein